MSCLEKMKDMTFICYEMKMNAIGVSTRNLVDLAQGESRNFEFFWIVVCYLSIAAILAV
jgi:hypothetical protein